MSASYDAPIPLPVADRPWRLRVEHLDNPVGLGVAAPRLSWRLPDGATAQSGYELRLRIGQADPVQLSNQDADHVLVPWPLPPLAARAQVQWQVRVHTDVGHSDWSSPATFELGLLDPADWQAGFIAPTPDTEPEPGCRPGYLLRRSFVLSDVAADTGADAGVRRARAYVTAHGIYELFCNGVRVGDAELTPGYTSYRTNLAVQTYDLTELLRPGRNVIGAVLTDGWYRGRVGNFRQPNAFGATTALLAQVEVERADGSREVVATDQSWQWAIGSISAADLMAGQTVDLTAARPGWSTPAGQKATDGWRPVRVCVGERYSLARLTTSPAPPVRAVQFLSPVTINDLTNTRVVVDFGQNINGWVRLRNLGNRSLTLDHGEALAPDGDMTNDHLASHEPVPGGTALPVGMHDTVVNTAGTGGPGAVDVTQPEGDLGLPAGEVQFRHTTHGFQYARLDGDVDGLSAGDVSAAVVHSDLIRTGWFGCSDDRLNRLHDAAVWSFRGNACDIPTDCPHRERAGWTGDWQLYVPTATFLYDVAGFSTKWLRDLAADQRDDGVILNFAPEPNAEPGGVDVLPHPWNRNQASSGWAEAIIIVPWEIYRSYGDVSVLSDNYPAMVRWLDYCEHAAATRRHETTVAARPDPQPHERYLWDTGYHWGEWLEPKQAGAAPFDPFGNEGIVATAYFYRAADLMARIADVLGNTADAGRYRELADHIRAAWQTEYVLGPGRLARDTQATYARALTFDLLPDDHRAAAADRLAHLVRDAGNHLTTGFLSTPMLLPRLADAGHWDTAFDLLYQDTAPSWLGMIDRGATTIWEDWEGLDEHGTPTHSLNHYSKGAVISFLHSYIAGLRMGETCGYRDFVVTPHPGGGLTWATATHDSPYGRIEAGWRLAVGQLAVHVTVPAGTSATVYMPDGTEHAVGPGAHELRQAFDG
jgi:alpha-L-rhamnosidase